MEACHATHVKEGLVFGCGECGQQTAPPVGPCRVCLSCREPPGPSSHLSQGNLHPVTT